MLTSLSFSSPFLRQVHSNGRQDKRWTELSKRKGIEKSVSKVQTSLQTFFFSFETHLSQQGKRTQKTGQGKTKGKEERNLKVLTQLEVLSLLLSSLETNDENRRRVLVMVYSVMQERREDETKENEKRKKNRIRDFKGRTDTNSPGGPRGCLHSSSTSEVSMLEAKDNEVQGSSPPTAPSG